MVDGPPRKHVVVLAHPDPQSFNAAVARTYCEAVAEHRQTAVLRDLYALCFDPVLRRDERPGRPGFHLSDDVAAELDVIRDASVLVLIYPIWFGGPPAILKGYVDRVLGSGMHPHALQQGEGTGLLNGARLLSFSSSAAREPWLAEVGQESSLRAVFDHYLEHAFAMRTSNHVHFGGLVQDSSQRFVDQHLYQVREAARSQCAAVPHVRGRWNARIESDQTTQKQFG